VSMTTLITGRGLVESPRWHGDRLYFSDWSAGEVLAVGLDGRSEVIASVRSIPLCTAWLPDGRLLIVSSADGKLLRREPDGTLVTHADLGHGGWNDIVIDSSGNAYVNGAGFNPMAGEAPKPGGVSLVTPDADHALRHRRRMGRHDRGGDGAPRQRPGRHDGGGRAGRGLAVNPSSPRLGRG
jgi:sugar lactone lactonase YvrE